jgi:predicted AlkP superfamily phosphohydrolase/phosphomutase
MAAFALPSFYDGRIRVNLIGREGRGTVEPAEYERVCEEIEQLVRACRDPRTDEPVVKSVERGATSDPRSLRSDEADIIIEWRSGSCAFVHPDLGLIGPVPYRRTGGHTGRYGFAYVADPRLGVGEGGVRSAFDVAPTIVELLGCAPVDGMSGTSLLRPASASAR